MSKVILDSDHPLLDARRSKYLCTGYKNKITTSDSRRIPFELNIIEYADLMCESKCAYTGVEFVRDKNHPLNISLERINPLAGYVKGNVVAITNEANSVKSTLDAFLHSDKMSLEDKIKIMSKVMYRLKKQLTSR